MITLLKNLFSSGYKNNPDAIIIACYFNPQRNSYRKKAFDKWYDSIKHLNHFILEAVPNGSTSELPDIFGKIEHIQVDQMLWHKETLLNKIIDKVASEGKFKYIFWLDTDIIFDNKSWLIDACKELESYNVVQPFEYCVHLKRDEIPEKCKFFQKGFELGNYILEWATKDKVWRSFGANVRDNPKNAMSDDYDIHGHVGFAWGAKTEYLKNIGGLYDKALIGGADHIMAHAFVGQIPCSCIAKSFGENSEITEWSRTAYYVNNVPYMSGISYVKGNLFHLWHGDIEKREYYKRIKEFTPLSENRVKRDESGFHVTNDTQVTDYFTDYLTKRENIEIFTSIMSSQDSIAEESHFEGGQFGGSGAGADWGENASSSPQSETNYNPTFS
jgi:hypothetical protein